MNRRNFLRTLAAFSAAGSSVTALSSSMAYAPTASLAEMLTQSQQQCVALTEKMTAGSTVSSEPLRIAVHELSALITQAQIQLAQRQNSAAFWQSCADAFTRTADQLSHVKVVSVVDAQRLFDQTARLLSLQTAAAVRMA